jgi:hypothetical protein
MTNLVCRITLSGLVTAGMLAYGQQPQANPQQPPSQTPADAPKQPQTAEQVFATLDTNHDGKLSQEEFAKLFRDAKVSDVQAEFARWDKNGDKNLTMEEFKAGYSQQ